MRACVWSGRLILCLTMSGRTARLITKYRPVAPILCATADEQTGVCVERD